MRKTPFRISARSISKGRSTVACPACGTEFVPKFRVEGRLRETLADFLLKRSHRAMEPSRSSNEQQGG